MYAAHRQREADQGELDDATLRALVADLPSMLRRLRRDLKQLTPSPWVVPGTEAPETILLRVVQQRLQPFATRFPGRSVQDEDGLLACREAWNALEPGLNEDLRALDRLTGGALQIPAEG